MIFLHAFKILIHAIEKAFFEKSVKPQAEISEQIFKQCKLIKWSILIGFYLIVLILVSEIPILWHQLKTTQNCQRMAENIKTGFDFAKI